MAKSLDRVFYISTILAILVAQIGILPVTSVAAAGNNFTVNSTVDLADANPGNGLCETTTLGECTLRAAIQEANSLASSTTIELQPQTTYTLIADSLPIVAADITINGQGATIERSSIAGTPEFRIIYVNQLGTLTLNDTIVENGSIVQGAGGGVYNLGILNVNNSTISNNNSSSAGGGLYNAGTLTVDNSIISGNVASGGGGIFSISGTVTVTNSTISGNATLNSDGGGLLTGGTVTVQNSTISNNSANGAGGGIFNGGNLTVTDSLVSDNTALQSGGIGNVGPGVLTLINTTISGNIASLANGGGVENVGTLIMESSTFSGNSATNGEGGGLFNSNGGTATIDSTTITTNTAHSNWGGGGIANYGNLTLTDSSVTQNVADVLTANGGGGLMNEATGVVTIQNSEFTGNSGQFGGGFLNHKQATITESSFTDNTATGDGGAIYNGHGAGPANLTLTDSTLGNNLTTGNARGGGLYNDWNATATVLNATFSGNSSLVAGGNIRITSGLVNLKNSIVENGVAPDGPDISGSLFSEDYNLIQDTAGMVITGTIAHNLTGKPADLSTLTGSPAFFALNPGSPAIDTGPALDCPQIDQRGVLRPQGVACDIGAYEAEYNRFLVTNTNNSGPGSLRQAILDANSFINLGTNPDQIQFDIPGAGVQTIQPTSPLPDITDPVVIDGYTQPGTSPNTLAVGNNAVLLIELDGSLAGQGAEGLTITTKDSTIRGLVINRFDRDGVFLNGNTGATVTGNVIAGNFIGTNASGTAALPNSWGVMTSQASGNTIGGTVPGARNLISGSKGPGVYLLNSSTGNVVQGNYIGTDFSSTGTLSNTTGVAFFLSSGNIIGGPVAGAGNLISGSRLDGVNFTNTSTGNVIQGNTISDNGSNGVAMENNSLGNPIRGNAFSNNGGLGIDLGQDGPTPNDAGDRDTGANNLQNYPDLAAATIAVNGDLVITYGSDSLNTSSAYPLTIEFFKADSTLSGEGQTFLGSTTLNAPGSSTANLGNGAALGVSSGDPIVATATDANGNTSEFSPVVSAVSDTIFTVTKTADTNDGTCDVDCSLREAITAANAQLNGPALDEIHFNIPGAGVQTIQPTSPLPTITDPVIIDGYTQPGSNPNTLAVGNDAVLLIELDGSLAGAETNGLTITVGGSTVRGLVINRFGSLVLNSFGSNGIQMSVVGNNVIAGNFIGTDASGTADLGNGMRGVLIFDGASNNTVGGVDPSARNIISGNGVIGVQISDVGTTGNLVQGNYIGTNAVGTTAIPNTSYGVQIASGASNNVIGGTDHDADVCNRACNLLSGNLLAGLYLDNASDNTVLGNFIGVGVNGTAAVPNSFAGVMMWSQAFNPASNNTLGGAAAGAGNVIAFNGGVGVSVINDLHDTIRGNAIYSNNGVGIDLNNDGATPNDIGDPDGGANNLQNYPELTAATIGANGVLFISYSSDSLNTNSAYPLTIEFFKADSTLSGEGQTFLGSTTLNAPGTGISNVGNAAALGVSLGDPIVATATDADGNTSEFSPVVSVAAVTTFTVTKTGDTNDGICNADCSLREAITAANAAPNGTGLDEIQFDIPGAGVRTIQPLSDLPPITDPVIIDGYTQPGASANTLAIGNNAILLIELDGTNAGTNAMGLKITASNSIVRGLVINRFDGRGIFLEGAAATGNVIQGNYIGTDASGKAARPNLYRGVGIELGAHDNTIGGIVTGAGNLISGNAFYGVEIAGIGTTNNVVLGNLIGVNADGTDRLPNTNGGILIRSQASGNTIGGTVIGAGNLISGNTNHGIEIADSGTTNNKVIGNYIGTNVDGTAAISNGTNGVLIIAGANGNLVGGTDHDLGVCNLACNLISGNGASGVLITGTGTTANILQGNFIGTNLSGAKEIPNSNAGVAIADSASGNLVGGTTTAARNLISGNADRGIHISGSATTNNTIQGNYVGTNADGTGAIQNLVAGVEVNAPGNLIGGIVAGAGNLISGNKSTGVMLSGINATGNKVQGNFIGTDAGGTTAVPNTDNGVAIYGAANNIVGGLDPGARNLISGNANYGLDISGVATTGNVIQGNRIGTNANGTLAVPNNAAGVLIRNQASSNLIGGTTPEARNLISGNGRGVHIHTNTTDNLIQGNYIGTDVSGTGKLPNTTNGVEIEFQATANVIGGTVPGAGNLISGNAQNGIWMRSTGTENNRIEGNFIGTDAGGLTALPNDSNGISIFGGAANNMVGGTDPGARNLISGNSQNGVQIAGAATTNNIVQGNIIGMDMNESQGVPNGNVGVLINGATNNIIGGTAAGAGNLIAYNKQEGVQIVNSASQSDLISGNSIFANGGLGINLGTDGPTTNDLNDADSGPNTLQNYPSIAGAIPGSGKTKIDGHINSTPNTIFTLDFYDNTACDPTGYGEGQTYLGSKTVTTDDKGNAYFTDQPGGGGAFVWNAELPIDHFVTVTATDSFGNTSEFSQCAYVGPDNVNWLSALRLSYNSQNVAGFDQFLGKEGEARWYKFSIDPGDLLTVTLTNLPANYDITVYKDINAIYQASLTSSESAELVGTEFADLALSPDRITDDYLAPDRITPDRITPDVFSADVFSPDRITSDVFSPDRITSDVIAPDRITPDRITPDRITAEGFSPDRITPDRITPIVNAQLRALVAVSAFDGTTSEGIVVNTWANTGDYYVRVLGRNGAFNPTKLFHIEVHRQPGTCGNIKFDTLPPTSLTGAGRTYKTLILSDFDRMGLSLADRQALQDKIAALSARPEVAGVWVDVGADARVKAANALADTNYACPYAKNVVAESIKAVMDRYRAQNQNLKYIVLLGNDHAIPFFRQPDEVLLGPESQYYPPVRDSSASQASLRLNYVLTQDMYGTPTRVSYGSQSLALPNLAVGRLVETPAEILNAIEAYLHKKGASLTPTSSLVTGYDFLSDVALAVKKELDEGTGVTGSKQVHNAYSDWLIADPTISPYATHQTNPTVPLDELPWTAKQLALALESRRHDLVFLAGHFSANSALAADFTTRYTTADLIASTADLRNVIVFSAGCHSGYNVVFDDRIPSINVDTDWAQAFTRRGAILIAGTGYQYGDTDSIKYNEELYLEFSKQLRMGTGPVSIGDALVAAKQVYLTNLGGTMRGIHAKAYLETTLFGLPMIQVEMPGNHILPPSPLPAVSTTKVTSGPGQVLDLEFHDATFDTQTKTQTRDLVDDTNSANTITTTYLEGRSGVLTNPAEPILPLEINNATGPTGLSLRGVGFRGGDYHALENIIPLTGAPTTELRGVHTLFRSSIFYPPSPWSVNYYDALVNPSGNVLLNLTPAQFISDSPEARTGTFRVYDNMSFRLFYSGYTGTGFDAAPPAILKVLSHGNGHELTFHVTTISDIAAGTQGVWITYTDISTSDGKWQSLDLTQDRADPSAWTGTLKDLPNPDNIRFMVQAVNGVGLVTLSTNLGAYYTPDVDPGAPPPAPSPDDPLPAPTTLTLSTPPTAGDYGATATITAKLLSNGNPVRNATVSLSLGFQSVQLVTGGDGQVMYMFPLNATPGNYEIRASFAGNKEYAPAKDITAPFTINKQPTTLTLISAINGNMEGFGAKLVDSEKNALSQQTIVFVMRSGSTVVAVRAALTDPSGVALPDLTTLPPGKYNVNAYFGQLVQPGDIELTNQLYGPSSDSAPFEIKSIFKSMNLLDDFNQGNGALSNQWQYRNTGSYRIDNQQLDVIAGGPIYWKAAVYGHDQGVQATFAKVDPNSSRQALLLKVQGGSQPDWLQGAIALVYDAKQGMLRVETYQPNQGQKWTEYFAMLLTLRDGDQLGAIAYSDGNVRIFLNGNLITTVTLNTADQTFFNSRGGNIGLWFMASNESVVDNFGGGTVTP